MIETGGGGDTRTGGGLRRPDRCGVLPVEAGGMSGTGHRGNVTRLLVLDRTDHQRRRRGRAVLRERVRWVVDLQTVDSMSSWVWCRSKSAHRGIVAHRRTCNRSWTVSFSVTESTGWRASPICAGRCGGHPPTEVTGKGRDAALGSRLGGAFSVLTRTDPDPRSRMARWWWSATGVRPWPQRPGWPICGTTWFVCETQPRTRVGRPRRFERAGFALRPGTDRWLQLPADTARLVHQDRQDRPDEKCVLELRPRDPAKRGSSQNGTGVERAQAPAGRHAVDAWRPR